MSNFDLFGDYEPEQPATLEEKKPPKQKSAPKRSSGGVYNFISLLFLLATVGVVILVALLSQNPYASFNPFPPPPLQPTSTLFDLSAAALVSGLPPTWTPSPTVTQGPSPTSVATPTHTPTFPPTATGMTAPPGSTHTIAVFPFTLQNEAVTYTKHPDGCDGAWIVGQVFGLNGDAVLSLYILVTGQNFESATFTGTAKQWGESGYEVFLNPTPIEDEFLVRLYGSTGQPLSEPIVVRTLSACERNVAVVNFVQNHEYSR